MNSFKNHYEIIAKRKIDIRILLSAWLKGKSIKTLLAIVCIVLSIKSYKSKGKQAINNGLDKVQKSVVQEEMEKIHEIDNMIVLEKQDIKKQ